MPAEFIPVAEDTGLISEIGEWVLNTACAEAAKWPASVRIAVNSLAGAIQGSRAARPVKTALAASGLAAGRLELEITETVVLQENEPNRVTLQEMRALGRDHRPRRFRNRLSSLSYPRVFPFSKIKIDQSFVRELGENSESAPIVRTIADLGRSLGVPTIAEGVEHRRSCGSCVRPGAKRRRAFCSAVRFRRRTCRL